MVDYSKWKNIEVSDDEDDTHPNIDTPSLFRWRHQARVERMEEREREAEELRNRRAANDADLKEALKRLEQTDLEESKRGELKGRVRQLEETAATLKREDEELRRKEKLAPWNVDTISKPGFEKTVINKRPPPPAKEQLTEEEREKRMRQFIKENEKELKHFGMLRKYDDSRKFLKEHGRLVCEDTANYLVIWCINLQMEEKAELMAHVAHQTICMQYMLELARQLGCDPRACVDAFFSKIQVAEPEYRASFEDELLQFKQRIERRAAEKLEEALREAEEERKAMLGPGGLDPVEVFESLPEELQECFRTQNIELLQETIAKMEEEQAKYHMKRCVDSGLWVPDAKKKQTQESGDDSTVSDTTTDKEEESTAGEPKTEQD